MLRLRGRVKPGHFRGLTFSDFDSEGRPGMFAVEIHRQFAGLYSLQGCRRGTARDDPTESFQ